MEITTEQIELAVRQLKRSERGRDAMKDLRAWIDTHSGLDGQNQTAVITLLVAAWSGSAGTVLEKMK